MAMTQEELEQFILDYMDEHIEERPASGKYKFRPMKVMNAVTGEA